MDTTINVIYDDRHSPQDYERLLGEFITQGITKFKFWEAEILTDSVLKGITASHKKIVQWAKDNKLKEVIIAEQDLVFKSNNGWKYFIKNKPDVYDVYIGGNYLIDNRCDYKPPLVKVNEWVGNHLIIINERYYDTWLNSKPDGHIDSEQAGKGEFYVCFPYPALQRAGKSANNGYQEVNYNSLLPEDYIYRG